MAMCLSSNSNMLIWLRVCGWGWEWWRLKVWGLGSTHCCNTKLTLFTSEEQMRDFKISKNTLQESVVHKNLMVSLLSTRSSKIKEATNEDFVIWHLVSVQQEQQLVTKTCHDSPMPVKYSDYIVVGRPPTADDPVAAYHDIKAQWTVNKFKKTFIS